MKVIEKTLQSYEYQAVYWNNINIIRLMGQSMEKPARASLRQSKMRLSARSLQKYSHRMTIVSKKQSLSASKLHNNETNEQISSVDYSENTKIRIGQLNMNSKYDQNSITVKEVNQILSQKIDQGGQNELHSPNFREIAQAHNEYGLAQWTAHYTSKDISPNETHNHDITISFNKGKYSPNVFQDEPEVRKSKLKKILEQEQENLNHKSRLKQENTEKQQYQCKEIQNLTALKSIYSESYTTPTQSQPETPKKNNIQNKFQIVAQVNNEEVKQTPKKQNQEQKQIIQKKDKKISQQTKQHQQLKFNDYDIGFNVNQNEVAGQKKICKISKKMQELKQKIANRSNLNRDKLQILRYSVQRLSSSFRKNRNSCSFDKNPQKKDNKNICQIIKKIKEKLSKTQFVGNQTIQEAQKAFQKQNQRPEQKILNNQEKTKKKQQKDKEKKNNKAQRKPQHLKKIKSDQKIIKVDKKQEKVTQNQNKFKDNQKKALENVKKQQLLVFNPQKTFLFKKGQGKNCRPIQQINWVQQNPISVQKQQKISFTEMIKKQHFNNKFKKAKGQNLAQTFLKFSQVQIVELNPKQPKLFASTCEQKRFNSIFQYQLFDYCDSNKAQKDLLKLKSQVNSLKKIAEELTTKSNQKKSSNMHSFNPSKNTSTQQHSLKNKNFQEKAFDHQKQNFKFTSLSFMNVQGHFEEYMLKDALGRLQESKQKIKEEKRNSKSTQHFAKLNGSGKNKLIIF